MHFLLCTEEQPNSSMTATCFYGSDDTLHDKPPFCMNYPAQINHITVVTNSGVPRGGFGVFKPPPKIPKALQNRAKLNPIVKTVKNC